MNAPTPGELQELKSRIERLEAELHVIRGQAMALEKRTAIVPPSPAAPAPPGPRVTPPPIPSPAPRPSPVAPPSSVPPRIPMPARQPERVFRQRSAAKALEPQATPEPVTSAASGEPAGAPGEAKSLEMQVGTYWLVRIGVVMLLTAMVFFGNYAYQRIVPQLGPAAKVTLLYLAGVALLGLGSWLPRRWSGLRNYAQVLFAGGLATIYFTTYAAHHFDNLRVIESAFLDGVLLLVWAGVMVWISDRRKSEVLSMFGLGLAFYSAVITRAGTFTLYSNLVLTFAALYFLVRNRWLTMSFAAVVATYASYFFWRFYVPDGGWRWGVAPEGLWGGIAFLACYWGVFTAAVFLMRPPAQAERNRATFLTLNNGAFFGLFVLTLWQAQHPGFWRFAVVYGAVLLALVYAARRWLPEERLVHEAYRVQGLVLITIGLIAHYSGAKLGLMLAAESVILTVLGQRLDLRTLRVGGGVALALAMLFTLADLDPYDRSIPWLALAVGAAAVFNALWVGQVLSAEDPRPLRGGPTYFCGVGLLLWVAATLVYSRGSQTPALLAVETALFTLSIYSLRLRELTLLGQVPVVIAQFYVLSSRLGFAASPVPGWVPLLVLAVTLGLSYWWPRQRSLRVPADFLRIWTGLYALATVGLLHEWLRPMFGLPTWLGVCGFLGVLLTLYAVWTRSWMLAAAAQILLGVGVVQFLRALDYNHAAPHGLAALGPIAALGVMIYGSRVWRARQDGALAEGAREVAIIARVYQWVALLMGLAWVHEYVPERERGWVLMLVGCVIYLLSARRANLEGFLSGALFTAAALVNILIPNPAGPIVYFPDLLALGLLLAQQRVARRVPDQFPFASGWQVAMIAAAGLTLWVLATRWVQSFGTQAYVTAIWAVLALVIFVGGLLMRERTYRYTGLGILAAALGRVILLDVWELETLYRTLSFFALGIVLLLLGFFYNRYQEKIRQWL